MSQIRRLKLTSQSWVEHSKAKTTTKFQPGLHGNCTGIDWDSRGIGNEKGKIGINTV